MSEKRRKNKRSQGSDSRDLTGIILIIISAFFLLCLIFTPVLSDIGLAVKNVVLGLIGFSAYPFFICMLLFGVFILLKKKNAVGKKRTALIVSLSVIGICILHLITVGAIIDKPVGDYVSAVYDYSENATAGGLLFGIFIYGIKSIITGVGAYLFFILLFLLFSAILTIDILNAKKPVKSNKRNYRDNKFVKGTGVAAGVESVRSSGLFIEDIIPKAEYVTTGEATFSDFDEREKKRKAVLSGMEEYFQSVKNEASEEGEGVAKAAKARDILFSDREKMADISKERFSKENQIHVDKRSDLSASDVGGAGTAGAIIKPATAYASPDIKSSAGVGGYHTSANKSNDNIDVNIKKAGQKDLNVVFPPPKEFSHRYVDGNIIDGDSLSRTLYTEKPKSIREQPLSGDIDFTDSAERARRFTEKGYEPMPEKSVAPVCNDADIIVGDYFKIEKKPATPVKNDTEAPAKPYYGESFATEKQREEITPEFNYAQTPEQNPVKRNPVKEEFKEEFKEESEDFYSAKKLQLRSQKAPERQVEPVRQDDPPADLAKEKPYPELRLNTGYAKKLSGELQSYSDYSESVYSQPDYSESKNEPSAAAIKNLAALKEIERAKEAVKSKAPDYDDEIDEYNEDFEKATEGFTTADLAAKEYADKGASILDRFNSGYYVKEKPAAPPAQQQIPSFDSRITLLQKKIDPKNQINIDNYIHDAAEVAVVEKPKRERYLGYVPPPPDLLVCESSSVETSDEDISAKTALLEGALKSLGIPAKVIGITRGPSVTRFELEMPLGIQVAKIMNTSKDIAYYLASKSGIRIEAPIPGRRAIGIEVPNDVRGTVGLRDLIDNPEFNKAQSYLTLSIGKDIGGKNIYGNLEKMPHLLIAGATGSGKSACLHSLLISILYKASPADVRLILFDPKRVEFTDYAGLPHMLINNVINERDHAINAFKWVQEEMERRYKQLAKTGVRNIQEYNLSDGVKSGDAEKMPNLVVVVDELSDLMHSSYKKEMEGLILSIAQKARASGVHLILATQRPSVDVITGTIKINLPSQIALTVNNFADSKTIIDQGGAEKLLGNGDLLYSPIEAPEPKRIQGAYVTSKEVKNIVSFIKDHNPADFYEDAEELIIKKEEAATADTEDFGEDDDGGSDPLLEEVCRKVIDTLQASTSMIQRRFKVGYARAARIIDQMEQLGFIGPLDPVHATKRREIYITKEVFKEYFGKE